MLLHGNTKAPQKSFKRSTDDASGGLTAASTALQCSPRRLSIATPSAASDASLQLCALQCITSGERRSIATPSAASGASVQLRVLHCITGGERRSTVLRPSCCVATPAESSPTSAFVLRSNTGAAEGRVATTAAPSSRRVAAPAASESTTRAALLRHGTGVWILRSRRWSLGSRPWPTGGHGEGD